MIGLQNGTIRARFCFALLQPFYMSKTPAQHYTERGRKGSYVQIWCMPMKLSGDLVRLFDLFSVNEFHAFDNLCQVREAT